MHQIKLAAFRDEFEKIARLSGAYEPEELVDHEDVPRELRLKAFERYVREKAGEQPTRLSTALMTGGVMGGALGGFAGLIPGGGKGALVGGLVGAAGGAGLSLIKALAASKVGDSESASLAK